MSESDFVTAVNEDTKLVSSVPRHYLTEYPQYKELSEAQVVELRRAAEVEMFGEAKTPALKAKAAPKPAEAPAKEGGK